MGKMFTGTAVLKGVSPLLMQALPKETLVNVLIRGERPPVQKDLPLEVMAAKVLYRENGNPLDEKSAVGIPMENVFGCLREAGRHVTVAGKSKISTAGSTILPAILTLEGMFYPLSNQAWEVDVRRGVMDNGTTVGIVRPKFKDWSITVQFVAEEGDGVTIATIRKLFDEAGRKIGLCAFRPQKNGPFGRFTVEKWEVAEMTVAKAA